MLTPRLKSIINHVKCEKAADIGTDHAYVPIALIEKGLIKSAIASDIKAGPASIAEENIKKHNMSDKIEVRIGAGLSVLKENEVDTIIIAGMGGEMIEKIITDDMDKAKSATLILQPMNSQYELRHFLINNGFSILEEDISVEGFKVYNLLIVKKGENKPFLKDIHYHIPPYLKSHPLYNELYNKKKREFTKVINGLLNSKDCDIKKLEIYKKWLGELHHESI